MLGPVLIGLATVVPMTGRLSYGRDYSVLLQLLPYLPVLGSLVVLGLGAGANDPFLLVTGGLLLVAVMIRQVMIVYENVGLTRDLEGKVAARTAELTTLGSIVTSSSDAIVGRLASQHDHGLEPGRGEALPATGRRRRRTLAGRSAGGSSRRDVRAAGAAARGDDLEDLRAGVAASGRQPACPWP